MSIDIDIEHHVAHTHTQNGLVESFIKRLQLIPRPLLLRTKLSLSGRGHAILHATALIQSRLTTNHECLPSQLVLGSQPNVSHLRIFSCIVYVPIAPPQCSKLGHQRQLGIYVGFNSPSIICYLEPFTSDVFTTRFTDCHFDENVFPPLREGKKIPEEWQDITWYVSFLSHLNPRTRQHELEV